MIAKKLARAIIAVSLAFFAASCVRGPKPAAIVGQKLSPVEAQSVLERLQALNREVRSYRALSRTTLSYEGTLRSERQALRHILAFSKPSSLRVETLPMEAIYALNLLVANERGTVFLDSIDKKAVTARSADMLIEKELRLPLRAEELMSYFTGRVPLEALASGPSKMDVYRAGSGGAITLADSGNQRVLILDPATLMLRQAEVRRTGRVKASIKLDDPAKIGGESFPTRISVELPDESVRLDFELENISINRELKPQLFEARIPGNFNVQAY